MSRGSEYGTRFLRALRVVLKDVFPPRGCAGPGPHSGRIEFAHVKPTPLVPNGNGRGVNSRAMDIRDHPDCYLPYCASCHLRRDGKNAYTERRRVAKS